MPNFVGKVCSEMYVLFVKFIFNLSFPQQTSSTV